MRTVVVCALLLVGASGLAVSDNGWSGLPLLANCSTGAFTRAVSPLAQMTKLSYTSTRGSSYWNSSDQHSAPDGWTRLAELKHDPPGGGMRALVFAQPASRRAVVAFRGTDLNRTRPSGQADMCADRLLWGPAQPLPAYCDRFSNRTLDYLGAALQLEARVRAALPGLDLLYTGHSLGAGLAVLVAAARRGRAAVFSSPGLRGVLRSRTHTDPLSVKRGDVFVLADEWDPVFQGSRLELGGSGLVGTVCTWRTTPGEECEQCYAPHHQLPNMSRADCAECFVDHHIFGHYLALVSSAGRPSCKPAHAHSRHRHN